MGSLLAFCQTRLIGFSVFIYSKARAAANTHIFASEMRSLRLELSPFIQHQALLRCTNCNSVSLELLLRDASSLVFAWSSETAVADRILLGMARVYFN